MANRLAREKSPYLLQHANNPVDWYPWGEEAFSRARQDDKPIFLSIGYSTCHWCHVMEHESFENDEVAALLNREFVPIKVDREERPDVDRVYMTFVQATTGSGGWPMSVWLTPDLKPFYGGTYFPPTSRWQRPGFTDVLSEIARAWKTNRGRLIESAEQVTEAIRRIDQQSGGTEVPGPEALTRAVDQFRQAYDARRGGFGEAPKFPRPSELLFLFREHVRTGDESARDMALHALRAMALGGMRDHVGGGFHRYSVDAEWRVPHFEKMLYDQAQLALAYLEAAQITGEPFYAGVAQDTLMYVRREMTDPGGAFYSAEDADSVPVEDAAQPGAHPVEGAFYAWRADEIEALGDLAPVVKARFGIEPGGNAPSDPQGEFTGKNLLYTARSIDEVAQATGRSPQDVIDALAEARIRLFELRLAHPRPARDDKVITAWNGLTVAAFARAARVLRATALDGSPATAREHLETASRAARFLRERMWDGSRHVLMRRYREGEVAIDGYAEDYAFTVFGLLELFEAGGRAEWLEWARTLQHQMDARFWDEAGGGWFSTTGEDPSVLLRLKEDYDGAEPTASSIAVVNLMRLAHLDPSAGFEERARRTLAAFAQRLRAHGRIVPMMASALSGWHAGLSQIVVFGARETSETAALLDVLATTYQPFAVVVPVEPSALEETARLLPFVAAMRPREGAAATAFVCQNFACQAPVTTADALAAQLHTVQNS